MAGEPPVGQPASARRSQSRACAQLNDTPHRLTAAIIFDLPFGRDRWIGRGMNPVLDAIVGGWALNNVVTLQSGQPLGLYNAPDCWLTAIKGRT